MKDKLIIFDMDNTILQSRIDFGWMQRAVRELLQEQGLEKYCDSSVAKSITNYCQSPEYDQALADRIWDKVQEIETVGMDQACLEPGAVEALAELADFAELAVLSNNTDAAIGDNLERLGLAAYLSYVAGRNSVPLLKPSPLGMLHVKERYPDIPLAHTVTVGDAMIDAQAAAAAGIIFVAYNRSRLEDWDALHIAPRLRLHQWDAAACDSIRRLFD